MKSKLISLIIIVLAIVFNSCLGPTSETNDLMTFTAYFEKESGFESRIVLADYNNLENYRFITEPELEAGISYISLTKNKVIIRKKSGVIHNDDFVLYDIEQDTLIELYNTIITNELLPLSGTQVYWDYDDKGFYYRFDSSWGNGYYYYDLTTNQITRIDHNIIGLMSENKLLVFQSNGYYNQTGVKDCFYTLDRTTSEMIQLINPHLEYINIDGIMKKSAQYLNWDESKQKILYSYLDSTQSSYRISATNYNGSYKKEYTNSYYDKYPVWGPDNIVFFNRVSNGDYNYTNEGAYVLNTKTGNINKLIDLLNIADADILINVSY